MELTNWYEEVLACHPTFAFDAVASTRRLYRDGSCNEMASDPNRSAGSDKMKQVNIMCRREQATTIPDIERRRLCCNVVSTCHTGTAAFTVPTSVQVVLVERFHGGVILLFVVEFPFHHAFFIVFLLLLLLIRRRTILLFKSDASATGFFHLDAAIKADSRQLLEMVALWLRCGFALISGQSGNRRIRCCSYNIELYKSLLLLVENLF